MKQAPWITVRITLFSALLLFLAVLAVGLLASDFRGISDLHGDNEQSATLLDIGERARGQIRHLNGVELYDLDWFGFPAEAGKSYLIKLKAPALLQHAVWISDPAGSSSYIVDTLSIVDPEIAGCFFYICMRETKMFPWTATTTGHHYFAISGVAQHGDLFFVTEGGYMVTVTSSADDYPSQLADAEPIAVSSTTPGQINFMGDQDWFTFDAMRGQTYEVSVGGDPFKHSVHIVEWRNWAPQLVGLILSGDLASGFAWTAPDSRASYILVTGTSDQPNNYTLTLKEQGGSNYQWQDARSLPQHTPVTGQLSYQNGADWFRLEVSEGQYPAVMLEFQYPRVPDLDLYASDGSKQEKRRLVGTSRELEYMWLTENPGDYYLVVSEQIPIEKRPATYYLSYTTKSSEG